MVELERRVLRYVRAHGLLGTGDAVVVALSGGPDSVALTCILRALCDSLPLRLHLAHLNHGLRGAEADADELFCCELAQRSGLAVSVERADVASFARLTGRSVEDAARAVRYDFLERVADDVGAAAVATGHHADDVAETVLMRLLRGAGVRGLAAMAPSRPIHRQPDPPAEAGCGPRRQVRLVRPLLELRRAELLDYLAEINQPYRTDATNLDVRYTRNRVRHELLPMIEQAFPTFSVGSLCALNASAVELCAMVEGLVDTFWEGLRLPTAGPEVLLDSDAFAALPAALRKAAADRTLEILADALEMDEPLTAGGVEPPALRAEHYDAVSALAEADPGAEVSLPAGLFARREHGIVRFALRGEGADAPARELPVPGSVEVPEVGLRVTAEVLPPDRLPCGWPDGAPRTPPDEAYLDVDAVGTPLCVRLRRPGDRFYPLGAPGEMKLKKFLIGRRVPFHERDRLPLVVTADGEIAWVAGCEIGERFRLREPSHAVLRLTVEPLSRQSR